MITELLIAAGAIWLLRRNKSVSGVGKVERIKRRIYKEVSLAQDAGVDFTKKYTELTSTEKQALERVGKDVGWKQSKRAIENEKPYVESYYSSLRRAWNAISGVQGIGTAYNVKDANGNICLTWIEDAAAHIEHEPQPETKPAKTPKAPKEKKITKKEAEALQRQKFASMFVRAYMDGDGWAGCKINTATQDLLNRDFTQNGKTVKVGELYIWAWGNKKYKISKRDNNVLFISMLDGKEYEAPLYRLDGEFFEILDKYYKLYLEDAGWRENEDRIDDIRIALLDKAKHMIVFTDLDNGSVDERGITHPFVKGDDRYKYLDWINWILWTHHHYDVGGDTYYPKASFDTKERALAETGGKMRGNGFTIIPVWEVPIDKISGLF